MWVSCGMDCKGVKGLPRHVLENSVGTRIEIQVSFEEPVRYR